MRSIISFSVLLKLTVILQEKLLKRMGSLWNMTQEMQNNLNQEVSKIESFEVRMKMFCSYAD